MICSVISAVDGGRPAGLLIPAAASSNLADRVAAFNGEARHGRRNRATRPSRPRGAGRLCAARARQDAWRWCSALHFVIWTALPILLSHNLQLDLAEDLALGKEWQLGYWKHPPLPWWIADLALPADRRSTRSMCSGRSRRCSACMRVWLLAATVIGELPGADRRAGARRHPLLQFLGAEIRPRPDAAAVLGVDRLVLLSRAGARPRARLAAGRRMSLALCFWSKYAAFALAGTLGLFLLFDPLARRAWRTPGP